MLQQVFEALVQETTQDIALCNSLWQEISLAYNDASRHYHNLKHLENLVKETEECRSLIEDYNTVLYAVFYHDIVYDVLRQDNEESSALTAVEKLNLLLVDPKRTARCRQQILATKSHALHNDNDTNLFTDADLAILGKDAQTYEEYYRQVRLEYAVYPDELYIPGRAKVLKHFLSMKCIYKTVFFYNQYEQAARRNMLRELQTLQ